MEEIKITNLVYPDNVLITNKTPTIKRIFHISDIHINLYRRHDEYRYVFNNLYGRLSESIQFNNIKSGEAIIVMTGDILHSKTELSPECIYITMEFFIRLGKIAPLIIIAGNHDANLNNKNRLDALSPIIEHLDRKVVPIYYLKESGIYNLYNISFGVTSVFDYKFIKASSIPDIYKSNIKIALYHGLVKSDLISNDVVMLNDADNVLTPVSFNGYNYVLLGDIHKHQYLNKEKTIAYAGSLIQQNFGESIDNHGVLEWDLVKGISVLTPIESSTGFITLDLHNGKMEDVKKCCSDMKNHNPQCPYPKNVRVRLVYEKLNAALNDKVLSLIKQNHNIIESRLSEIINDANGGNVINKENSIINVSDLECQQKYIEVYLKNGGNNVSDSDMGKIRDINKELNQIIVKGRKTQNLSWKLRTMKWSNMFSFGEDNFIDFTKLNNIVGVIGPNHTGKSAIIDIILYALYHKFSRKGDIKDIINIKHDSFEVNLTVQIGNRIFHIDKAGKYIKSKKKLGELPVSVDFFETDLVGNDKIVHNGTTSKETIAKISEFFGTYDDVVLTNVSLQNNNTNFVDMTDTPRKTELERLLKIDIFSALKDEASRVITERKTMQKYYDKLDVNVKILERNVYLETCRQNKDVNAKNIEILEEQIQKLSHQEKNDKKQLALMEKDINIGVMNDIKALLYENDIELKEKDLCNAELIKALLNEIHSQNENIINDLEIDCLGFDVEEYYDNIIIKKQEHQQKVNELTKKQPKTKLTEPEHTTEDLDVKLKKYNSIIKKFNTTINSLEKDKLESEKTLSSLTTEFKVLNNNRNEIMKGISNPNTIESQLNELYKVYTIDIKKLMLTHLGDEIKSIVKGGDAVIPKLVDLICNRYKSIGELSPNYQKYIKLTNEMEALKNVSSLDVKITHIKTKIEDHTHEIDAISDAINKNMDKVAEYEAKIIDLNKQFEYIAMYDLYIENKKQISKSTKKLERLDGQLRNIENIRDANIYIAELMTVNKKIETLIMGHNANEGKTEIYKSKYDEYEKLVEKLTDLQSRHKNVTADYYRLESECVSVERHIKELETQYTEMVKNMDDIRIYQYYLDAVRNIPFMIIDSVKNKIESLINEMLAPLTDFTIHFEIVENKHISIYLKRNDGVHRREILLSNASGFEKFISSLFIRVALIQISNLPKSNFIVIDEGWSCFDASNINNAGMIFDFLKEKFDFVLTISHIQDMRQHLNHQIVINQADGYSHVSYNQVNALKAS